MLYLWLNWWKIQRKSISAKNWWDGFHRNIADWRTISFESDFAWGKRTQKVQFFINYVDQGIYGIGKLLPKTIVKVNWLFFINSNYVLQRRELTQNLKSCFLKIIKNCKSISYQFCIWHHLGSFLLPSPSNTLHVIKVGLMHNPTISREKVWHFEISTKNLMAIIISTN